MLDPDPAPTDHPPEPRSCFGDAIEALGIDVEHTTDVEDGWDSRVVVLEGEWVARFPRREDVAVLARVEARLLPELADHLPVDIPVPAASCEQHGALLYRRLDGEPASADVIATVGAPTFAVQAADLVLGLRRVPEDLARHVGIIDLSGERWRDNYLGVRDRFRERVLPLVAGTDHPDAGEAVPAASALLDELPELTSAGWQDPVLIHGDLGPDHVLCDESGLTAVIDWTDARLGDPAHDLAWLLHGTSRRVAATVRERVAASDAEVERARVYHQLAPWYEVEHGIETGDAAAVGSALHGLVDRLARGEDHQPRSSGRPSS